MVFSGPSPPLASDTFGASGVLQSKASIYTGIGVVLQRVPPENDDESLALEHAHLGQHFVRGLQVLLQAGPSGQRGVQAVPQTCPFPLLLWPSRVKRIVDSRRDVYQGREHVGTAVIDLLRPVPVVVVEVDDCDFGMQVQQSGHGHRRVVDVAVPPVSVCAGVVTGVQSAGICNLAYPLRQRLYCSDRHSCCELGHLECVFAERCGCVGAVVANVAVHFVLT